VCTRAAQLLPRVSLTPGLDQAAAFLDRRLETGLDALVVLLRLLAKRSSFHD
jgi:hypothetical protein